MNGIERLSPEVRSAVHRQLHGCLVRIMEAGKARPIYVKRIFMITAQGLSEEGIIERPPALGNQSYPQLIGGNQPQLFPDYGMPDTIADFIRQSLWELCIQGILAPGWHRNPLGDEINSSKHPDFWLSLEYVVITPYGINVLSDDSNRIQVHDPDGYLSNFWNASPAPDEEMMRYLKESISVFRAGHLLACVILLGIASERLIEVLAESLRDSLGEPDGSTWFQNRYNKREISARFAALTGKLMGEYTEVLERRKLKEAFQGVVTLTFEEIRLARNDIAHLAARQFTWNEVSGLLHHFVQYFGYINRIVELLTSEPKNKRLP